MGSEIALDLKLCAVKSVNGFLRGTTAAAGDQFSRLDDCVHRLEEEKQKIEAFKRELPLSVRLISQVITSLREEQDKCRSGDMREEFIVSMKGNFEEDRGAKLENDNKMSWMSSAQLWSDNNFTDDNIKPNKIDGRKESKSLSFESKPKFGAFVSLEKEDNAGVVSPALSLVLPAMKSSRADPVVHEDNNRSAVSAAKAGPRTAAGPQLSLHGQQQPPRKARRCWSPELHRRFVVALQQLGGPQVATPKQIRELMKVDGLSNDEVKSHLQKYRLHQRRSPNSSAATENKPVVWVGGLWAPQDHFLASSQQSASQSGSPEGPVQLTGSIGAVSLTAGDSYEEEDGKSESYGWK